MHFFITNKNKQQQQQQQQQQQMITNSLCRLKRSSSQELDEGMEEFKRGGVRSTASGRIGKLLKVAKFVLKYLK